MGNKPVSYPLMAMPQPTTHTAKLNPIPAPEHIVEASEAEPLRRLLDTYKSRLRKAREQHAVFKDQAIKTQNALMAEKNELRTEIRALTNRMQMLEDLLNMRKTGRQRPHDPDERKMEL